MKILITGGTGFIGSYLCERLLDNKHEIVILSRNPEVVKSPIKGISNLKQLKTEDSFDIIINLAGEPIAGKRWTDKQKDIIFSSRIDTTINIIEYLKGVKWKPKLLISGSAIGYYGLGNITRNIDEQGLVDESFSSHLCQQWEAVALEAKLLGIRTCLLRTGIVIGKNGGALSKMLLPFQMGLGGKIGDGKQWMSWIHLKDLVGIILFCMENEHCSGAINGTSPNSKTNMEFTKTLGKVLNRPTIFPMPSIVIKLLMGQMGQELLLSGKQVLPVAILKAGYKFQYEKLEDALSDVL